MNHVVSLERGAESLALHAPYHERFIRAAKALPKAARGKWDSEAKVWRFPLDAEDTVRALCAEHYGDDGETADLVTLRIEWRRAAVSWQAPFYVNGRVIARAFGRRTGAKLGEGVTVQAGGFDSGGTGRDWETTVKAGTVALLANVPRHEAAKIVAGQAAGSSHHIAIAGSVA